MFSVPFGRAMIVVDGLRKSYRVSEGGLLRRRVRTVHAVDDISFAIDRGALVGFLGPNGAGKSTTLKVLAGILVPDSGSCQVDGRIPWRQRRAHAARIGVVFGQRTQLWWDLPVRDSYSLLATLYGLDAREGARRRDALAEQLDLAGLMDIPVRQLSLGQRMRCEIGAALLHAPDVLFLDEPTIGLDIDSRHAVRMALRTIHRNRGTTVLLATHDLHEVEALCSRILLIDQGRLLVDDTLQGLRETVAPGKWLVARGATRVDDPELAPISTEGDQHAYRITADPTGIPALLARVATRHPELEWTVQEPSLEAVVRAARERVEP
ncbi:MAG: ATP-binding cassette domain-containing protein [Armatimonadota bacterium]